jgi:resuscitation-promoting factor RpfA
MSKSADAFRTISEVAEWLDTPAHVLRFWESKFTQVKPVKRAGGRRYYRPGDMRLLGGIKKLLHDDGMTIKGVQKILREQGIRHVSSLCTLSVGEDDDYEDIILEEVPASEPVDTVVPFAKPADPEPVAEEVIPVPADVQIDPTPPEPVADLGVDHRPVTSEPNEVAESTVAETVTEDAPKEIEASVHEPKVEQPAAAETDVEAPVEETIVEAREGPDVTPEVTEEADARVAETAALPGFLQRSITDRIEHPEPSEPAEPDEPAPEVTDSVPEPEPVREPAEPTAGALTHLARIKRLSPEAANQIEPVAARLRSLIG